MQVNKSVEYFPGAHGIHRNVLVVGAIAPCEQLPQKVCAFWFWNVPIGHATQSVALGAEYVPPKQASQIVAPVVVDTVPGEQAMHVVCADWF